MLYIALYNPTIGTLFYCTFSCGFAIVLSDMIWYMYRIIQIYFIYPQWSNRIWLSHDFPTASVVTLKNMGKSDLHI